MTTSEVVAWLAAGFAFGAVAVGVAAAIFHLIFGRDEQ